MSLPYDVWAVGGSGQLSPAGQALAQYVAGQLLASRARLAVGCCTGADAAFIACAAGRGFALAPLDLLGIRPSPGAGGRGGRGWHLSHLRSERGRRRHAAPAPPSSPGPVAGRTCTLSPGCAHGQPRWPMPPRRAGSSSPIVSSGLDRCCWPPTWPPMVAQCMRSPWPPWCPRRGLEAGSPITFWACPAGGCQPQRRLRWQSRLEPCRRLRKALWAL